MTQASAPVTNVTMDTVIDSDGKIFKLEGGAAEALSGGTPKKLVTQCLHSSPLSLSHAGSCCAD